VLNEIICDRNYKSIYIAPLESSVAPLHIPLARGGDAFWLDSRTVAHIVSDPDVEFGNARLFAISLKYETEPSSNTTVLATTPDPPVHVGTFPIGTPANFKYSAASGHIVFSAYAYGDWDLSTVARQDKAWEERGTTAMVYDDPFARHWDTWVGPKTQGLFAVALGKDLQRDKWTLGKEYVPLLKGTGQVRV
jgi:hypothetical protein